MVSILGGWLVAIALVLGPARETAEADDVPVPTIRAAVVAVLDLPTNRSAPRLARVSIADKDVTVVFAMRNEDDDPLKIGAGGRADALQVMRAIYSSADAASGAIESATVLGTYAVYGKFGRTREIPLLRIGLRAEHADRLANATADSLTSAVDDWWQQPELGGAPSTSPVGEVRRKLDIALVHLNTALFALSSNDVRIVRSQFKQYFDVWEDLDELMRVSYPDRYPEIDTALNRVELALLHRQPEDLTMARDGLHTLRAQLAEIAADFDGVT